MLVALGYEDDGNHFRCWQVCKELCFYNILPVPQVIATPRLFSCRLPNHYNPFLFPTWEYALIQGCQIRILSRDIRIFSADGTFSRNLFLAKLSGKILEIVRNLINLFWGNFIEKQMDIVSKGWKWLHNVLIKHIDSTHSIFEKHIQAVWIDPVV